MPAETSETAVPTVAAPGLPVETSVGTSAFGVAPGLPVKTTNADAPRQRERTSKQDVNLPRKRERRVSRGNTSRDAAKRARGNAQYELAQGESSPATQLEAGTSATPFEVNPPTAAGHLQRLSDLYKADPWFADTANLSRNAVSLHPDGLLFETAERERNG